MLDGLSVMLYSVIFCFIILDACIVLMHFDRIEYILVI
jgi:hypothetical protein